MKCKHPTNNTLPVMKFFKASRVKNLGQHFFDPVGFI